MDLGFKQQKNDFLSDFSFLLENDKFDQNEAFLHPKMKWIGSPFHWTANWQTSHFLQISSSAHAEAPQHQFPLAGKSQLSPKHINQINQKPGESLVFHH